MITLIGVLDTNFGSICELQLSGLVTKRQGKLFITNPIYREVFNQDWIDQQLSSLRPYSENFRAWVASGCQDRSRLLRGQALILAEEWAKNKSLSYQDKEFLAAGRNLAIEEENEKAQLERERQDKEAELERERQAREVAESANRQAQRRIRLGNIILSLALLGAGISTIWGSIKFQDALQAQSQAQEAIQQQQQAEKQFKKAEATLAKTNKALSAVRKLSELAGELRKKGEIEASNEAWRKAGSSTLIDNWNLKQAWLLAATAEADPSLGDEGRKQAQETIKTSLDSLNNIQAQLDPRILNQVRAFVYFQAGKLKDKKYYQYAYDALKASNFDPFNSNVERDIFTEKDVEEIHYRLIKSRNIDLNSESNEIAISFRKHLYNGLEFLLSKEQDRLKEADRKTWEIMLYIADSKEIGWLPVGAIKNFSCPALRELDKRWYKYHKLPQHFGLRVQKEIWQKNGSPMVWEQFKKNWRKFYIEVGWKTEESGIESGEGYVRYENLSGFKKDVQTSKPGNLPAYLGVGWIQKRVHGEIEEGKVESKVGWGNLIRTWSMNYSFLAQRAVTFKI